VLKEKASSWQHGLSPTSRQDRLESALLALKGLTDAGLGAASVLANLHHRRIVPLMERELRIYEISKMTNPVSLACSQLLHDRFPSEYAATRVRRTISLKAIRHGNDDLWLFVMLPDAPPLSRIPPFFIPPRCAATTLTFHSSHKRVAVNAMRSDRPRPEPERARGAAAGAGASGAQEGAKDPAAGAPGTEEQGIPAARAVGTLSSGDLEVLVVGRGRRGRK
jgi:hypothetical protein